MTRPLMSAVAAQQQVIAGLRNELEVVRLQLAYVARVAGLSEHFAAIRKECDADNPAQPVPNPPSEAPSESTEETLKPLGNDNPNTPGQTPGVNQGVAAETTTTPMDVGTTLPTTPYNQLQNVTAPVSGTETHTAPDTTRIETDVRVGDPMNPSTAFPLNPAWGPSKQSPAGPPKDGEMHQTGSRTLASLKLAKLRVQAGVAPQGSDEFALTASIESSNLSAEAIAVETRSLTDVIESSRVRYAQRERPANLVPKSASQQRPVSLQVTASEAQAAASSGAASDAEDLFL